MAEKKKKETNDDYSPTIYEEKDNNEMFCYSWKVKLNHQFPEKLNPFQMPRLKQAIEFIPLTMR